ncbi:Ig-like domain-containing protein [Clostridium algidicarnis]|nr:Ig-like domain-containing protein [Clostridium algidicarnis]MCB2287247.1 Ig-like domain-containing protein [Clostridium algidicarnis]
MLKKKKLITLLTTFTIIGTLVLPKTNANAAVANGWEQNGTTWNYYINNSKATGWISNNSYWYFLNPSGNMETGWVSNNGSWYFLNSSGDMATGWKYLNNKWYYLESSGAMSTGWISNNNNWYYLKPSGDMDTGWVLNNNQWYYLKSNGAMATGWVLDNNTWYYLNSNGSMKTGWITTNSKSYYLNSNGSMAVNTKTPDGYTVGADGAWDGKPKTIIPKVIKTTSVSLNKTTSNLILGETDKLQATVNPSDASNKAVTWKSSDNSILTVDANGTVTAVNKGTAIITVTTVDGNKTASCTFTVNSIKSVSLNKTTSSLTVGETDTLLATINPANAKNKAVTWKSSDDSILTVDAKGTVTAINEGTAIITVTTVDENKTASCSFTVNPIKNVSSVSLNKTTSDLIVGQTDTLLATVNPKDATNKDVKWKSSDDSILTVDTNGTVTAINQGTAIITVTTVDGSKSASCTFTVNPIKVISINDITVDILQNDIYKLPTTVVATMNTGKIIETKVLWNPATVDTSKLGVSIFEGTVDGYDKVVKLTLNVKKYEPNLYIYNYSSITINNICKSLSINVNNNGDKPVTINKIEVYEKGKLATTYNKSDLMDANISPDILPNQSFGISISYKLGIFIDNSYVKYYIECNGNSFEYKEDIKRPTF